MLESGVAFVGFMRRACCPKGSKAYRRISTSQGIEREDATQATYSVIRSYVATMHKPGANIFESLAPPNMPAPGFA